MLVPTLKGLPLRFYTVVLFATLFAAVTFRAAAVGQPILALCTFFASGAATNEGFTMFRKVRRHVRTRAYVARK